MVKKVTYQLDLKDFINNSNVDPDIVGEEVGQYLVEEILSSVAGGKSPVSGKGWKNKLSPAYKKYKSQFSSSKTANMELHGDMLDSLTFKVNGTKVEVGIFDEDQAQKADNHNKFSAASKKTALPERRFIPNAKEGDTFKRNIIAEVNRIIEDNSGE